MIKITQLYSGWLVSIKWSKLSWILPNESSGNQSLSFAFTFKGLANHLELNDQKMCSLGWNTFDFRSYRVLFFVFMFSFVCCFLLWQDVLYQKRKKKKRGSGEPQEGTVMQMPFIRKHLELWINISSLKYLSCSLAST